MYTKKLILEALPKLPNAVNLCILRFNHLRKRLYGKKYAAYYNFLVNNQKQFDNRPLLLAATNVAINEVSYYRQRYGSKPINSVEDFEVRIGTIDKDTILDNFDDFINPQVDTSNYDLGTTGGTSGKPLRLLAPKDRYVVELATMHFLWANEGFDFQPRAVIRNHRLPKDDAEKYIFRQKKILDRIARMTPVKYAMSDSHQRNKNLNRGFRISIFVIVTA